MDDAARSPSMVVSREAVSVFAVADLPFDVVVPDALVAPTHVAMVGCRLVGLSGLVPADPRLVREIVARLPEILALPGRLSMTVRIGVRGTREEPELHCDLVVALYGDAEVVWEARAVAEQLRRHLGGRLSPFQIQQRSPQSLGWPRSGVGAMIRQQSVVIGETDDAFELPVRFKQPGPDAGPRLLASLLAGGPGTDLFVSATPSSLWLEEEEMLRGARVAAEHLRDEHDLHKREAATLLDAVLSLRTDLHALQVLVTRPDRLDEVLLRAVGTSLTAPYDTMRDFGVRVVADPRAFVCGGFDVVPCPDTDATLERLSYGLPTVGLDHRREIVDLVTSTELGFVFAWPVDIDGTIPGLTLHARQAPQVASRRNAVRLGRDAFGSDVVLAAWDRVQHLAVLGASGSGKTTLLARLAAQDMEDGRAVVVVCPQGDLALRCLDAVPRHRRDDVVFLDGRTGAFDRVQLLRVYPDDPVRQNEVGRAVARAVVTDLPDDWAGPVFMRNYDRLVDTQTRRGGTLLGIEDLVADMGRLRAAVDETEDRALVSWARELRTRTSSDRAQLTGWVVAKNEWLRQPGLRETFDSTSPTVDLAEVMAGTPIVVVCPGTDDAAANTAMSVFLSVLRTFWEARTVDDPLVGVYLDEVHRYTGGVLARLMNEARKRSVALHLATQNLSNVKRHAEAILGNAGSVVVGRVRHLTAEAASGHLGMHVGALTRLPNFESRAVLSVDGAPSEPFTLHIDPPTGPPPARVPDWLQRPEPALAQAPEEAEDETAQRGKSFLDGWLERRRAERADESQRDDDPAEDETEVSECS